MLKCVRLHRYWNIRIRMHKKHCWEATNDIKNTEINRLPLVIQSTRCLLVTCKLFVSFVGQLLSIKRTLPRPSCRWHGRRVWCVTSSSSSPKVETRTVVALSRPWSLQPPVMDSLSACHWLGSIISVLFVCERAAPTQRLVWITETCLLRSWWRRVAFRPAAAKTKVWGWRRV